MQVVILLGKTFGQATEEDQSSMKELLDKIIGLLNFDIRTNIIRGMNASFLKSLNGDVDSLRFLKNRAKEKKWKKIAEFYLQSINGIHNELPPETIDRIKHLLAHSDQKGEQSQEKIWKIFYPEACGIISHKNTKITELRAKREIKIEQKNNNPIKNPAREILFTSNILVTVPAEQSIIDELELSENIKVKLKEIQKEKQLYWYDHPIQIGVSPARNEVIYGLVGLDEAVEFEKNRGTIKKNDRVTLVLSVSVTHHGLKEIVKQYIKEELKKSKRIKNLDIYIFTDSDTKEIIDQIIIPALGKTNSNEANRLHQIFGVDGEYGRHYSFLKAVAALWNTVIDKNIKATFKIDTDQIFPENELVEETGRSAFEHFTTPLWGALGIDTNGDKVELGMIAGALVNQSDTENGLFTTDVKFPEKLQKLSDMVFFSSLPQALSTEAEMMTRYKTEERLDGENYALQRVHVTGGTNGILVSSLMKHRPFTPTFVGRAEDQAYILSTLYGNSEYKLRYVHKDGLIMRHDKEAFAQEAIKAAHGGKVVGDYIRTIIFSYYAGALEWEVEKTKDATDPFTGGFVSKHPISVVTLRMALDALAEFEKSPESGEKFVILASERLTKTLKEAISEETNLKKQISDERDAWNNYYDALDNIKQRDSLRKYCNVNAKQILENCHITFHN